MMRIYSAIFDLIWRAWNMFFALFSPCKCLEHPIIFIIFTSIFLIRRWDVIAHDPRLDGSLKLVLLCFCLWLLTRVPFVNCLWWSYDQLILVIVRPGSSVTLSGAHQPLIHFFITFKYTLVIGSTIVSAQSTFLSNHKIDLGHDWSVPSRVLSSWGWRFRLELRLPINCNSSCSWSLSAYTRNYIARLCRLFKFNLNCSLLFRNW